MASKTFIARAADGLPLMEASGEASGSPLEESARRQVQQLLTRLHSMPTSFSAECDGGLVAHVKIASGVCFLGLFSRNYPPNVAFAYLEELRCLFMEELKREFGTGAVDYQSHIDTVVRPYQFMRFERQVVRTLADYRDPSSSKALSKVYADLTQVTRVLSGNIDEILSRGEALHGIQSRASHLAGAAHDFASASKSLATEGLFRKYAPVMLGIALLSLISWMIFCGVRQLERGLSDAVVVVSGLLLTGLCGRACFRSSPRSRARANKAAAQCLSYASDQFADHML